jgi:hypothetical protein
MLHDECPQGLVDRPGTIWAIKSKKESIAISDL